MVEKYATYSVEDFVGDEMFIEWVKISNPQLDSLWQKVIDSYPAQRIVMYQARNIILLLSEASDVPFPQEDKTQIWNNIENQLLNNKQKQTSIFYMLSMLAASILLFGGIGWMIYQSSTKNKSISYEQLISKLENPMKEVTNSGSTNVIVKLPDGSIVHLAKNSKLSYVKDFSGKNREVYLSGAAFFDVTKNPEKPFVVYANELVTKVLGTSFTISAFDKDNNVTVAVKTGKVSVFANHVQDKIDPETKGLILIPNQKADFKRNSETLTRSLVDQPKVVIGNKELEKFNFNDAPVNEIFTAMERAYGVDFLFDPEVLTTCRLTTSLSEETLFEKLDVICEAIGATYKVVDAQIVINAKKCT